MWRRCGGSAPGRPGLVLAVFAVAALVVLPFTGRAIDRRGPLPVLLVALVTAALGALGLGLVRHRADCDRCRRPRSVPGRP